MSSNDKSRAGPCAASIVRSEIDWVALSAVRPARARVDLAGGGLLGSGDQAFALGALAGQLAGATHSFRLLAGALLRGLLVVHVPLHLAERAFALHLLLQRLQSL